MSELAGATDRGRPDTWPKDAGEFAARWNAKTLIERDEWVDVFIETQIARERLGREVEDLKSELHASKRMHEKARVLLSKTLTERNELRRQIAAVWEAGYNEGGFAEAGGGPQKNPYLTVEGDL